MQFTFGRPSDKSKIRIVVFASGWNPKQEYDNKLVKKLCEDGYKVDVVSYDIGEGDVAFNNHTNFKKANNVKRIAINLLEKTEAQKVKKELNDNANQYEHTVYIDGFGSEDHGEFHKLYKDILTKEKGRTCLNWCTCCQAPQEYSQKPKSTPCNANILFPSEMYRDYQYKIRYDAEANEYRYVIMSDNGMTQIPTLVADNDITDEQRKHVNNNITNKKLNADFSPSLVESICSKIKQQEQKNVLQFDTSRLFDNKSQIYKEEKDSNIYKINNEGKSAVRFTKYKSHNDVISAMTLALKDAIKETKQALHRVKNVAIDEEFINKVINFAIQNDGVGMKQSAWKYGDEEFKTAKRLSYEYQKAAKEHQLFTGNESTNYNNVGARLKRIPTQHIESIITQAMKVDDNNRQR